MEFDEVVDQAIALPQPLQAALIALEPAPERGSGGSRLGIELMHMIKKKQMVVEAGDEGRTAAKQFYALAA